ncbi:carbamoyltransferase HypF [Hydrogenimonas sp.]
MARPDSKRRRYRIGGIVQGVGFRPFVYRTAVEIGLGGFVRNDGGGVTIEAEGSGEALRRFERRLREALPPLARIDTLVSEEIGVRDERSFRIVASGSMEEKRTAVGPDTTLCGNCIEEMYDPRNRRYRHPFINCTDCGPRYTITLTVPYDRPNTSMAKFEMCERCRAEYEDPKNRRYHAQPISCRECGPRLGLWRGDEKVDVEDEESIEAAARFLKEGKIVAVKGLGGFHLMCDATNGEAVGKLRERKRRPSKPFAVMVKDRETARALAEMGETEERLLTSKERPIVVMRKSVSRPSSAPRLSDRVAPDIDRIGLMLPYTPLHHLLFDHIDLPLVATSANLSDEPIIRDFGELMQRLGHVVDAVLDHDRDIVNACDDSVVQVVAGKPQWLRLARGIAPMTLPLPFETERRILAVGAHQKNTIALAFGEKIVISPHIGDLNTIEATEYFERTVETFGRFYDFAPDIVVHDRHPAYETTRWAKNLYAIHGTRETLSLQHHYAHALAVMAEYGICDRVLAFTWDGTGYGEDGTLWGGEALLADLHGCRRIASLRPFRLLGGERAVREPRRVALSLLFDTFTVDEVLSLKSPTIEAFRPAEIGVLHQAWRKGINAPVTSSMGRLFDAVASLAGICQRAGYEGESGLRIEAGVKSPEDPYPVEIEAGVVDWRSMVREMVYDDPEALPGRFIATLAEIVGRVAATHPELPVVLAGGVFQNRTLCEAVMRRVEGRELLLPSRLPVNDGAISLGQLWYALHHEKEALRYGRTGSAADS